MYRDPPKWIPAFFFALCSYRYTLDELLPMMTAVRARSELYDQWASTVTETLEAKLEKKKGTKQWHIKKCENVQWTFSTMFENEQKNKL